MQDSSSYLCWHQTGQRAVLYLLMEDEREKVSKNININSGFFQAPCWFKPLCWRWDSGVLRCTCSDLETHTCQGCFTVTHAHTHAHTRAHTHTRTRAREYTRTLRANPRACIYTTHRHTTHDTQRITYTLSHTQDTQNTQRKHIYSPSHTHAHKIQSSSSFIALKVLHSV